jgi:hypothetical protein
MSAQFKADVSAIRYLLDAELAWVELRQQCNCLGRTFCGHDDYAILHMTNIHGEEVVCDVWDSETIVAAENSRGEIRRAS